MWFLQTFVIPALLGLIVTAALRRSIVLACSILTGPAVCTLVMRVSATWGSSGLIIRALALVLAFANTFLHSDLCKKGERYGNSIFQTLVSASSVASLSLP